MQELFTDLLTGVSSDQSKTKKALSELEKAFQSLETLIAYQKNDKKYRPFKRIENFNAEEKAVLLQRMREKLHRLLYHPMSNFHWQEGEEDLLKSVVSDLAGSLQDGNNIDSQLLLTKMTKIIKWCGKNVCSLRKTVKIKN